MTSEEMTTGSIGGTEAERKWAAVRSRWWNSTGGGSLKDAGKPNGRTMQKGNIQAGDGGAKFREQWADLDKENWQWMKDHNIDSITGIPKQDAGGSGGPNCGPVGGLRRPSNSQPVVGAVVEGGRAVGEEGRSWVSRNKLLVAGSLIFFYVMIARLLGEGGGSA